MRLQNRVALVTGGGRGIGRAIAVAFGAEGARVAVTARTSAELEEVVGTIRSGGGQAIGMSADLAAAGGAARVMEQVTRQLGPVEVLVNNAGVGSSANPKPVVEFDDDFWELSLRLNLTVPYLLCKAALPPMLAKGWGRIVNIASINSRVGSLHGAAYAASKHGLLGLTRTLALETAKSGVTVNAICPGPVRTVMNDRRIAYDAQRLGRKFEELEASLTPIGGRLEPDDIAPVAVYFASDEARMVTGQAYNICGGMVMS
jgi:meso-butanediol dehydrogenase/(S,S)-butanediol dehydrogenase/diacetyl reductase